MNEPVIERLSPSDTPSSVQLSHSVGWPDTAAEWRVIHEAALVLGARRAGQLIGQGALGLYESAGSIAKMVVSPDVRRQGVGAAILDGLLREAESRSLPVVGLVATALGRPLYESRGFQATGGVCILMGTPRCDEALLVAPPVTDAEQILEIERRFNGNARAAVLRGRMRESNATALLASGFALATAHELGARVGPVLADTEETARSLTLSIFRALGGQVRVDVPVEQSAYRAWLLALGLVEKGVNVEMSRGGALPWSTPQRFALATQAWG